MTARELRRLGHAVLLPAIADTALDANVTGFLRAGGVSLLLGETREEYVAREMAPGRRASETAAELRAVTARVRELAAGPAIVAVDHELGGIRRLEHLVPALPDAEAARAMPPDALAHACATAGAALRALGVNLLLAPVLDLCRGENPWLAGREPAGDRDDVARVGAAFVVGAQGAGVAATAKHFPGHRGVETDPAVDLLAVVPGDAEQVLADLAPFAAAVGAGVRCVMVGPGTVPALDPDRPALVSPAVLALLREDLGFAGLAISDDLDAASVLADRTIERAAVESLAAGCDLLLVSAENDLGALADAIATAVEDGELDAARLEEAAGRVRQLGAALATS